MARFFRVALFVTALCVMLVAALPTSLRAAPLPPRPPDATYSYAVTFGGAPIGSATVAVDGSAPGAIVVKENASFTLPLPLTATTTTHYDPTTLHQTSYAGDFDLPTGKAHVEAVMTSGTMHVVATPGGTVDIPADATAPLELVGDRLVGSVVFIPAILNANGVKAFTMGILAGGRALVAKVVPDNPSRPASVPATDATLSIDVADLRLVYWYDPATYVVHDITIPAQQAEFRLTATTPPGVPVAPPSPVAQATPLPLPPAHYTSRDVRFTSADGTVLAGTVTVPIADRPRFAAVVFVHGSGPQDRDERIGPNPIFLQLANALSNAGYVVLRYDKRGVAESGGRSTPGTRDEFVDDVKAAYAFARTQSDVDPQRVYLLGHSEGAELVPTVAAQDPSVAGVILLAPPALPLSEVLMKQALSEAAPGQQAYARAQELAALDEARHSDDAKDAWLRTSLDVDPAVDIARVHAPILILQGEGDVQVAAGDLPRLVRATRATNHDVTVETFSGDNHLFEPIVGPPHQNVSAAVKQYLTVPAYIDQRVLGALERWMSRHAVANATAQADAELR